MRTGQLYYYLRQAVGYKRYSYKMQFDSFTFFRNYFRENVEIFYVERMSKNRYLCIFIHDKHSYRRICKNCTEVVQFWDQNYLLFDKHNENRV